MTGKSEERKKCFWISVVMGFLVLALSLGATSYYVWQTRGIWEKDERLRIKEILLSLRSSLENELFARIYYTRSVAAYVSLHPDLGDAEFHNLAGELVRGDSVIQSMSLSPEGILSVIYPKEGLEEVLGLDLLAHPERRKIVEQTIRTGKTFVAGPVELVEGGFAFISYTPVFDKTSGNDGDFWGMADIVIRRDDFLRAAGLEAESRGASIALKGVDGQGHEGDVFFGDPGVFANEPVEVTVRLPDGEWILAGYPTGGWSGYFDRYRDLLVMMLGSSVVIATLIGFLSCMILRLRSSERRLASLNDDKNRLISVMAHDLRTPMGAISGLTVELLESENPQMSPDERESLRMIHECADEGLLLLENLLSWVRSREGGQITEVSDVDLNAVCDQVQKSFSVALQAKNISVECEMAPGTMARFDARILATVLRNLVSNAVKFSDHGGVVRIRCLDSEKGKWTVVVEDEGCGMEPSRVAELMKNDHARSYRGIGSEKGAGIGLTLCRGLLRECGEELKVESALERGTTVSFSVPKSSAPKIDSF